MQSEENSDLTGGQHVRGFSKLKSSMELANETQASSGKKINSSVVRTIAGSLPHEEQCVELHMNGAENSRKWRYRNLLNELKVLFHLSWPICFFPLGADFVSAGGQYFLWPFKHSHLCCICCSSVISEHLRHCFHYRNKHRRRHTFCPILWRRTLQGNGVHPSKSYTNLHSLYISLLRCIHSWRSYSNALFC